MALVERGHPDVPLVTQAALLGVSRASLYYQPVAPSSEEVALKQRSDALYTEYPFYGSRRIAAVLRREGTTLNRKAVQRHRRAMGIAGISPGPNTSKRGLEHRVYPYLLRHTTSAYPHHVWGIDITYIRLRGGWMYLVAVLDWYSRYVVSWQLDQTLELGFVLIAVEQALAQATPAIWNSDQGSHFTSPQYLALLGKQHVRQDIHTDVNVTWLGVRLPIYGRKRTCRSAWMARAARSTTSLPSGSGAPSSMRRFIATTTPIRGRPARG